VKHLAVLVLVTACSSGGTTVQTGGVSRADYLTRAEAICTTANTAQSVLKTPTAVDALAPYVTRIVAIADKAATDLSALEPPKADKKALEEKVLTPLREQLVIGHDYAGKVAVAAGKKDNAALVQLLGNPPTKTKADLRWMKDYGFKECVDAADTSG
jgi:hypothetical protein